MARALPILHRVDLPQTLRQVAVEKLNASMTMGLMLAVIGAFSRWADSRRHKRIALLEQRPRFAEGRQLSSMYHIGGLKTVLKKFAEQELLRRKGK